MSPRPSSPAAAAGHEAAVMGVVVAGVLTSFVIPGPFDLGSLLIGLLLLAVVGGYGAFPDRNRTHCHRAVAAAAGVGLCLLLVVGSVADQFHVERDGQKVHFLTDWPAEPMQTNGNEAPAVDERLPTREDSDRPSSHDGGWLLCLWLVLSLGAFATWFVRAEPASDTRPTRTSS